MHGNWHGLGLSLSLSELLQGNAECSAGVRETAAQVAPSFPLNCCPLLLCWPAACLRFRRCVPFAVVCLEMKLERGHDALPPFTFNSCTSTSTCRTLRRRCSWTTKGLFGLGIKI
jgi:hypothetical protein